MKKLISLLFVIICWWHGYAQNYTPVDKGSDVAFTIKNFGIGVSGNFKGLKGKISFNPSNFTAASFTASVDAASVSTGNASRNRHLQKEEYLDVAKYPLISFVSSKITRPGNSGTLLMEGKITIRGVAKTISFPFTAIAKTDGYLLTGAFQINRRDFGVGGNSMVMSDNIKVTLSVFAKKN